MSRPSGDEVRLELDARPEATERVGRWVGERLKAGQTVALCGPLGAGKTTFVRGVAQGLGVDDPAEVHSPTYLLVVEHPGEVPLLHADAYLPEKLTGFLEDGGLEYLLDADKVVCVEWADNVHKLLPESALWVHLGHGAGGGRWLHMRGRAQGEFPWLADLSTILDLD
ncbi:MAG: tRNA (adenosine(37)-N6)-threonylcarbamoyltransferase complex ATPase subunit type 1 TsaE [Planctomycetota bacterium]